MHHLPKKEPATQRCSGIVFMLGFSKAGNESEKLGAVRPSVHYQTTVLHPWTRGCELETEGPTDRRQSTDNMVWVPGSLVTSRMTVKGGVHCEKREEVFLLCFYATWTLHSYYFLQLKCHHLNLGHIFDSLTKLFWWN